jgi:cytochrome b involved in lipid metabolism
MSSASASPAASSSPSLTVGSLVSDSTLSFTFYSLSDLSSHNSFSSAWIAIHGYVYDITNFLFLHPGGPSILLDNCGKDASDTFQSVFHSQSARKEMSQYLIGELEEWQDKRLPWTEQAAAPVYVRVEREI